jgi:hypothetical protein
MPKKEVSVEVESSGYELMQAFAEVSVAYKQALADGFQPGQDLPGMVTVALAKIPGILADLSAIPADIAESKVGFLKGVNLGAYDLAEGLLK